MKMGKLLILLANAGACKTYVQCEMVDRFNLHMVMMMSSKAVVNSRQIGQKMSYMLCLDGRCGEGRAG